MQPDCTIKAGFIRRALAALLLGVCVLASQAGVATHALGHALEDLDAATKSALCADGGFASDACEDEDGGRENCPLHALFAELASMAVGAWPAFIAPAAVHETAAFADAPAFAAPRVAFRSRAPPPLPA